MKTLAFSAMFQMRTSPLHKKLKQLIDAGELGEITRINWIVTHWFRTEAQYARLLPQIPMFRDSGPGARAGRHTDRFVLTRSVSLIRTYQSQDWDRYRMDYREPFRELEPHEDEVAVVGEALNRLQEAGVLPHTDYDHARMLAHRRSVVDKFEIPWTAISPRMQRLLYAVNAIVQPSDMIAAGVFCGNTFISNAGAAVGPGSSYTARNLVGVEIVPEEAERAERNVRAVDPTGVARVVAADAVEFVGDFTGQIDLLYLDADGAGGRGKGVYLDILEAGYEKMPKGAVVLAHNSVNASGKLNYYLEHVRDPNRFRSSVNVIFDPEGLEVSVK